MESPSDQWLHRSIRLVFKLTLIGRERPPVRINLKTLKEFNRGLGGGFGIDGSGAYCNESDSKDYLEIRNGYEDDAPPLNAVTRDGGDADAYFCGRTAPSNLISSGNEVLINFKSDDIHSDTGSYPGFQLRYRAVGTGCGGDYVISESDPAGWFTSPNYPDNYDSNEFCIYTIRGDPGISIRLEDQQTT